MPNLDAESRIALAADEAEVHAFLSTVGGQLIWPLGDAQSSSRPADQPDVDDGVRVLDLHPASAATETFWARLIWSRYPYDAASVTFLDGPRGVIGVARAWPRIPGYRAPGDICMPFTAEGYRVHPEWRTGPHAWITTGNPFLRVAQQIQDDLDTRYEGRAA